jgi:uncharacterized protein YbcI
MASVKNPKSASAIRHRDALVRTDRCRLVSIDALLKRVHHTADPLIRYAPLRRHVGQADALRQAAAPWSRHGEIALRQTPIRRFVNPRRDIGAMLCKSIGELESEISQAVIHFEKEFMGRGPLETKTYLIDDMVVVRLKGVLTPSEMKLAETDGQRGRYLLKQVRQELIDHGRPMLEAVVRDILGVEIRSLHTDISTKTGERIIVLSLAEKPTSRLTGNSCSPKRSADQNARRQLTS